MTSVTFGGRQICSAKKFNILTAYRNWTGRGWSRKVEVGSEDLEDEGKERVTTKKSNRKRDKLGEKEGCCTNPGTWTAEHPMPQG